MGVKICNQCGKIVSESRLECPHCGDLFNDIVYVCSDCGEQYYESLKECKRCGSYNILITSSNNIIKNIKTPYPEDYFQSEFEFEKSVIDRCVIPAKEGNIILYCTQAGVNQIEVSSLNSEFLRKNEINYTIYAIYQTDPFCKAEPISCSFKVGYNLKSRKKDKIFLASKSKLLFPNKFFEIPDTRLLPNEFLYIRSAKNTIKHASIYISTDNKNTCDVRFNIYEMKFEKNGKTRKA